MLLSLIKKITSSSSSNEAQTNTVSNTQTVQVVNPDNQELSDEIKLVNLPSWKDKSIWNKTELKPEIAKQCQEIQETITDLLRTIKDPEKPNNLDDLNVILEDSVKVLPLCGDGYLIRIDFHPTVPHCSLASLIGLCLRNKIKRDVVDRIKLDIVIAEGKHSTEEEINKQINDKERVAAAMENPNLKEIVDTCIKDNE